ncbi:MAG: alpha/beta fold hydrolase, partial [Catalinimonas sp.]
LRRTLGEYRVQPAAFFTFTSDLGDELRGWMIKPRDFDERKQYPVLMYVYGGPGSQTVENRWLGANYLWYQMMADRGYIVVSVDGRGTGGRGAQFKKQTYAQLGKLETEDQRAAARYLKTLPYVDGARVGIWGWSYGGYMTLLALTRGDEFKAGIAVAPVTTWRFYDTIYTERYLKTPQKNARGYDENSPLQYADQLEADLLLVHGTGDDNVHFQNSVFMQDALIAAGKQFRSFYYPNRDHGIRDAAARAHLYRMMTDFLEEKL